MRNIDPMFEVKQNEFGQKKDKGWKVPAVVAASALVFVFVGIGNAVFDDSEPVVPSSPSVSQQDRSPMYQESIRQGMGLDAYDSQEYGYLVCNSFDQGMTFWESVSSANSASVDYFGGYRTSEHAEMHKTAIESVCPEYEYLLPIN